MGRVSAVGMISPGVRGTLCAEDTPRSFEAAAAASSSSPRTKVMRYPQLLRCGPNKKCLSKLQKMYSPFAAMNCTNAIHVGSVQSRGEADVGGACRCATLGLCRELAGSGDGERSGCDDVYDLSKAASGPGWCGLSALRNVVADMVVRV